jgi:TolB-like protein
MHGARIDAPRLPEGRRFARAPPGPYVGTMADLPVRLQHALGAAYRIEHELGGGGMSRVFVATETALARQVVVKVLPPDLAAGLNVERFQREVQLAAKLQHPHIVPVLSAGAAEGLLYYTMPLIEGESLHAKLAHEGELPITETVRLLRDVADALAYAHTHGVAHRDIKPANVLISNHHAVVTDFGVAKALSESTGNSTLTSAGVALGTPAYMAPEQAAADPHTDHRCDIYGVGALGYEMLTGRPPFTGPTPQHVLAAQVTETPEPVTKRRAAVPPALTALVMRCLEKSPADRWQTAEDLLHHLEAMATPSGGLTPTVAGTAARAPRSAWSVWGRWPVYAGIAALGLLGGFAALARSRARSGPSHPAQRPMLVVLPFENLGRAEDEYFADGMTEEVTARLAGLHGLGVIGRTSAIQYKKTTKTIPQIGQELGVDYILEGSVRWDKAPHGASRVRVTPQLVRVSDASHVWANVYDAVLADVFDVQSKIATQVADTLDVTLLAPERQALAVRPTANLEAYDYYLRGTDYSLREFRREDAELAVQMYDRAVQLDPAFALAYDALARAQLDLSWIHGETSAMAKAKAALARAQQLGPELAETHLALGYYYYYGSREYGHALEQFEQVRQRKPNDPDVISAMGYIRRRQGQWEQSLTDLNRASDLDPRNHELFYNLSLTYGLILHRYAEARQAVARAITLAPDVPVYHAVRANLYILENGDTSMAKQVIEQGGRTLDPARIMVERQAERIAPSLVRVFAADYRDALARFTVQAADGDSATYYLRKAAFYGVESDTSAAHAYYDSARVVLEGQMARRASRGSEQQPLDLYLALAYAGLGRRADAVRLGRKGAALVPVSRDAFAGPIALVRLAAVYVLAGEYDAAIDELEYLLSIPAPMSASLLRVDPLYAPLRRNPRFERLVGAKR